MSRLPIVGSDADDWGTVLNDYLSQSINPDGTLNTTAVLNAVPPYTPNPNAIFLHPIGGTSDDTPQIRTALNDAVANCITRGDNYAEIWFQPGQYHIKSPLIKGQYPGTGQLTYGNAQIPIPFCDPTAQKVVIALRSFSEGSSLPLWTQNNMQQSGACLITSGVTGSHDSNYGQASVLGGPTPEQGYGTFTGGNQWNNCNIVIDGISIMSNVLNPTMSGFDFGGCAQATIGSAGAFANGAPGGIGGGGAGTVSGTPITNTGVFGLRMPKQGNNDECMINSYTCEGFDTGILFEEHLVANRICCIYCNNGLACFTSAVCHANWIAYASIEQCQNHLQNQATGARVTVNIAVLDCEHADPAGTSPFKTNADISDSLNLLKGEIGWYGSGPGMPGGEGNAGGFPIITNGTCNLVRILNKQRSAGIYTNADGVTDPVSTSSWRNPFWRDCMIYVSGATFSLVQVASGGNQHNLPNSVTQIFLPSGAYLAATFTGSPTWTYQLI